MLPLFEVADVDQARAALAGGGVELLGAVESNSCLALVSRTRAAWQPVQLRRPPPMISGAAARIRPL
jgi:hypothetical protein